MVFMDKENFLKPRGAPPTCGPVSAKLKDVSLKKIACKQDIIVFYRSINHSLVAVMAGFLMYLAVW